MSKWAAALLLLGSLAACGPPNSPHTVSLVVGGETRPLTTEALTVREVLSEAGVTLDEDDRLVPAEPTFVEDGMTVRVIRVETRTETEEREVPFERRTVRDASVPAGETRVLEPGETGIEGLIYRTTLEDGVETARRLVERTMLQEPRTEVLLVGVQGDLTPVAISGTVAYIANHNAWVMQTISSNQQRLTDSGDLDGRVFALSPDGSHVLFTRPPSPRPEAEGGHFLRTPERDEEEDSATVNTLWLTEIAAAAGPVRLHADSILWADWEPGCHVAPAGTGCRIAYATGTAAAGSPGWKAQNDLWVARPRPRDGELLGRRRIVEPGAGGAYGWWGTTYAWSSDGRSLAYARADEVGVIRSYDGSKTTLTRFPPYRTYGLWVWTPTVDWSPEGSFIVTTVHGPAPTGEAPEDSPVFDVWALAGDGTLAAELISEAGMWAAPAYAPKADYVVFGQARSPYASQSSGYELYVMDRDGSDRRLLFPPADEIGLQYPRVAWGPTGDRLIVVYQGNLYLIGVPDGNLHQLTDSGSVTAVRWQW